MFENTPVASTVGVAPDLATSTSVSSVGDTSTGQGIAPSVDWLDTSRQPMTVRDATSEAHSAEGSPTQ